MSVVFCKYKVSSNETTQGEESLGYIIAQVVKGEVYFCLLLSSSGYGCILLVFKLPEDLLVILEGMRSLKFLSDVCDTK